MSNNGGSIEVIFNETKYTHEKLLTLSIHQTDKILSLLAVIPILMGFIISSTIYVHSNLAECQSLFIDPISISLFFLAVSLLLGLLGVFPMKLGPFITPANLYSVSNDDRKDLLHKLTQSYLIDLKEDFIKIQVRPFIIKLMVILTILSIFEFVVFGFYHVINSDFPYVSALPYVILLLACLPLGWVIILQWKNTKRLKTKLELDHYERRG